MFALRPRPKPDAGFSVAEVMVTLLLMGIIMTIGVGSWTRWALAEDHKGTRDTIETVLRQTQMRAVTEGVAMCVSFDTGDDTYTVYRNTCGTGYQKISGPFKVPDQRIHITDAAFQRPDGVISGEVTFRPSGRAWPGSLLIRRTGSDVIYKVSVEGFTGRVSVS